MDHLSHFEASEIAEATNSTVANVQHECQLRDTLQSFPKLAADLSTLEGKASKAANDLAVKQGMALDLAEQWESLLTERDSLRLRVTNAASQIESFTAFNASKTAWLRGNAFGVSGINGELASISAHYSVVISLERAVKDLEVFLKSAQAELDAKKAEIATFAKVNNIVQGV
jgi:hypothetical protein